MMINANNEVVVWNAGYDKRLFLARLKRKHTIKQSQYFKILMKANYVYVCLYKMRVL